MSAMRKNLDQIWSQLRSQKASREDSLEDVRIRGLRGISDLRVPFLFPVTVLAGPNGCGKSTVLFSLACAYEVPGAGIRDFTPAAIFPEFRPSKGGGLADERVPAEMSYSYLVKNERRGMKWSRNKAKWNRSFLGMKGGSQPSRLLFLRTLANLSNPSEVRSVLSLAIREYKSTEVDASNIAFAQRILSYQYDKLNILERSGRSILFAERGVDALVTQVQTSDSSWKDNLFVEAGGADASHPRYSEFHMSAGERSLLRLSMNVSKMENALVLIDEVEAGLHPHIQQILMLELQRLALRNKLQIVVTTHSPAILDTVPAEARVFLERRRDNVVRKEAYRDIIQKALYGRSLSILSILCEDEESESLVRGVLDRLGPKVDLLQNDIEVGRDTGKDQFPAHLETLGRFRKLGDVVFVLDGDGRAFGPEMEAKATKMGQVATLLFLPGNDPPEMWGWVILTKHKDDYAEFFGLSPEVLEAKLRQIDRLYEAAADKPSAIAKNKFYTLANESSRTVAEIFRNIGEKETGRGTGAIAELVNGLQDAIARWRSVGEK